MIPGLPDYDASFGPAFLAMCSRLAVNPLHLLGVGMNESGMRASADNPDGNASGLWQLMPDTARGLGWEIGDCEGRDGHPPLWNFRSLSPTAQLPWFERYYAPHKGKLVSRAACYVCTFLPADLDLASDPQAVLVDKSESDPKQWRRGWAYSSNMSFDANHDLKIQVFELEDAIVRALAGAGTRYQALLDLVGITDPDRVQHVTFDPTTALGQEEILQRAGFYSGALDGIPGPQLRAAIVSFQRAHGLAPDGIVGPNTRAALAVEATVPQA